MKTILVPLDGSPIAEAALPYARRMACLLGAQITLLSVVSDLDPEPLRTTLFDELAREIMEARALTWSEALRRRTTTYLAAQAAELRATGLEVKVVVQDGAVADLIVAAAAADDVALLVMGGHGYSGLRRWALGSTTDKVVHAAAKPVLVVHAAAQPVPDPALRCIMVPLDGSALARQALPLALKIAERAQAELFLMTALTPPLDEAPWSAQLRTEEAATLATVREHLLREADAFNGQGGGAQIPVAPLVALGFAAEAIVDAAVRHNVDLIVMAAHGYSGLRRWTLGSVADKVLHAASVPVLLVPQAARLAPEAAVAEAALA